MRNFQGQFRFNVLSAYTASGEFNRKRDRQRSYQRAYRRQPKVMEANRLRRKRREQRPDVKEVNRARKMYYGYRNKGYSCCELDFVVGLARVRLALVNLRRRIKEKDRENAKR